MNDSLIENDTTWESVTKVPGWRLKESSWLAKKEQFVVLSPNKFLHVDRFQKITAART